jgi:hypothetical protein
MTIPKARQMVDELIDSVHARLSKVLYFPLPDPVKVFDRENPGSDSVACEKALKVKCNPAEIHLSPPANLGQIIDEVMKEVRDHMRETNSEAQIRYGRKHYEQVLKSNRLWREGKDATPDVKPDVAVDRLQIYEELKNSGSLAKAKRVAIRDLLFTNSEWSEKGNAFRTNGHQWAVCDMKFRPEDVQGDGPIIYLEVQLTDFFTYRVFKSCGEEIRQKLNLSAESRAYGPNELHKYVEPEEGPAGRHFQGFIHLGLGDMIYIQTIPDNKLWIRQRSRKGAADDDDGGKWAASANEGFKEIGQYFSRDQRDNWKLKPLNEIVDIALKTEVLPEPRENTSDDKLIELVREYWLTGILLYVPNRSINLCFLVRMNRTAEYVELIARDAPHKSEFDLEANKHPEFTPHELYKCLKETILGENANEFWDEGSLAGLLMAMRVQPTLVETGRAKAAQTKARNFGGRLVDGKPRGTDRISDPISAACGLKVAHPEMTDRQIALQVGVNPSSLSRNEKYQRAKQTAISSPPPGGSKNRDTGEIEAIDG